MWWLGTSSPLCMSSLSAGHPRRQPLSLSYQEVCESESEVFLIMWVMCPTANQPLCKMCFPLQNKFDPTVCQHVCVCVLGWMVWNLESQAEHKDTTAACWNYRVVEVTALRGSYYPLGLWVSQLECREGRLSAEHGSMIKYHRWKCFWEVLGQTCI